VEAMQERELRADLSQIPGAGRAHSPFFTERVRGLSRIATDKFLACAILRARECANNAGQRGEFGMNEHGNDHSAKEESMAAQVLPMFDARLEGQEDWTARCVTLLSDMLGDILKEISVYKITDISSTLFNRKADLLG